ncbi:hypothetical protein HK405_005278 [Cladochytrium tenue]|nr:hypothetical protein HK405_005278 [Cladochytrium tenue]
MTAAMGITQEDYERLVEAGEYAAPAAAPAAPAMSLADPSLPAEVLDMILMWLHPHQVYALRRLSRALFDSVGSICAGVSFASRSLRNLEANRSFARWRSVSWREAQYMNVKVDFGRLPLSYMIALFMNEDEPTTAKLADRVADALENILIESPDRFRSFGEKPGIWLYLITKVGRTELTRVAVERAADEFNPAELQDTLNLALIDALHSANQAMVDCIFAKIEVQPQEVVFACVASQPDLNFARSFLSSYAEKFGEAPTNYLSEAVLFAAHCGHCDVAEHLLTLHSDLRTLNLALAYAIREEHMAVCQLLLSAGADPLHDHAWPLKSAFIDKSAEVVELLLRDLRVKRALEADGTLRTRLIQAAARSGVAVLRPFFELGVAHLEDAAMLYASPDTDIGHEGKAELLRFVSQRDIHVLYALVLGIDYRRVLSHTVDINAHQQPKEPAKSPDSAPIPQEANNIPPEAIDSTSVWAGRGFAIDCVLTATVIVFVSLVFFSMQSLWLVFPFFVF